METTIRKIGQALNEQGGLWAIGGSVLLSKFYLEDSPNDIDILVREGDIDGIVLAMDKIGSRKSQDEDKSFATRHFYQYEVDGISVDIISNFIINHDEGSFEYIFDKRSISFLDEIDEVHIPFSSLEDWCGLYLLMGREKRFKSIEDYFRKNGLGDPYLLERFLKGNIPQDKAKMLKSIL